VADDKVALTTLTGAFELRRPSSPEDRKSTTGGPARSELERLLHEQARWQRLVMVALLQGIGGAKSAWLTDGELVVTDLLRAIERGWLVVVAPSDGARPEGADAAAWGAFDSFQAAVGREFQVATRTHRLVPLDRVDAIRQTADFDVVPVPEASAIVSAQAKLKGGGTLVARLNPLLSSLTSLSSSPASTGFVLLRAPLVQAARFQPAEDILTPGKLKKLKESHWIEVVLETEDGEPWVGAYSLELPDGRVLTGVSDADGKVHIEEIMAGTCKFVLPGVAPELWGGPPSSKASTGAELGRPVVLVDEEPPVVEAEAHVDEDEDADLEVFDNTPTPWELLMQIDVDDPEAQDDELILLDSDHNEVERVDVSRMAREGKDWVRVRFEKTVLQQPYTLIRDHGPDEGGGVDVLFENISPRDLDKQAEEAAGQGAA
jgi:hypothetical protein